MARVNMVRGWRFTYRDRKWSVSPLPMRKVDWFMAGAVAGMLFDWATRLVHFHMAHR